MKLQSKNFIILLRAGILLSILLLPAGRLMAGESAGDAASYLRSGVGARALAMGNAGTAGCIDATAAYWNPAAMVGLDGDGIGSQTGVLGWERSWNFLNYCHVHKSADQGQYALALSWINFSAGGEIEARTSNRPEPERIFGDAQNSLLLSAAATLGRGFALGVNTKLIMHNLDEESASGFGLDLSAWQVLWSRIKWGLVIQDLYTNLAWSGGYVDRLPIFTRAGLEFSGLVENLVLVMEGTLEFSHSSGTITEYGGHLGAEYYPLPQLALRVGVNQGRFTTGAGFSFFINQAIKIRLDYALAGENAADAGLMHLFSLVMDILPTGTEAAGGEKQ